MYKAIMHLILVLLLIPALPSGLFAATLTDLAGRKVTVPDSIERAVALKGALSILCYLDAVTSIVGVENEELPSTHWIGSKGRTYSMAYPHLGRLPAVGSRNKPNPEKIISLKPQVIFIGASSNAAEQLQRQTGIPVVVLETGDLGAGKESFYRSLSLAAEVMGRKERAGQLITRIEKEFKELKARISQLPSAARKEIYVGGLQFKVGHGLLGTSRDYPPFQAVYASNVADRLPVNQTLVKGRFSIDTETLLSLAPEVIFISESGKDAALKDLQTPLFRNLPAVRTGQIYGLLPHYYSADPATVLAEAWYVGKVLYPDHFREIEIAKKADELYRFFNGRPLYAELEKLFGGFKPLVDSQWKR